MTKHAIDIFFSILLMVSSAIVFPMKSSAEVSGNKKASSSSDIETSENNQRLRKAEGDFLLGLQFTGGEDSQKDFAVAARHYRKAADLGHMRAQYNLAHLYCEGLGVERDFQQAAFWFRKAAEQGDSEAANNLGVLYATGQGVSRDDTEAIRWYRLAAEHSDTEGISNLASMYLKGRGVEIDLEKAFYLFRKAAEHGYRIAQNNLALMYANGQAVERDYLSAYAWLDLAKEELDSAVDLQNQVASHLTTEELVRASQYATELRRQFQQESEKGE